VPNTYTELLAAVRSGTREVALDELKRRLDAREAYTLLDVREPDEVRAGHIPGAIAIPRGLLEMQIEGRIADKTTRLVTYCTSDYEGFCAGNSTET
jgi:rhodanese-related sulfurtransferase